MKKKTLVNWASPERQNAFAKMGDELVITPLALKRESAKKERGRGRIRQPPAIGSAPAEP